MKLLVCLLQTIYLQIVEYTSSNIQNFRRKFEDVNSNKYTHCDITDLTEMNAFIGIFYIRAALKVNTCNSNETWYHESSNDLFAATMSLKRFHFLTGFIESDKASREERWQFNKFACIRDFFETVNEKNASTRSLSPYLAIDETLYPYRGSASIKQYNLSKPAKYGLLYRSLCDPVVPYTYHTLPYAGKPSQTNNKKDCISWTDEYTKHLVNGVNHSSMGI